MHFVYYILGNVLQDEEYFYISLPLFVIYTIFSLLGIMFAVVCLVFELWFRNQKYVISIFVATATYNGFFVSQISKAWESICQCHDYCWCSCVLFDSDPVWSG